MAHLGRRRRLDPQNALTIFCLVSVVVLALTAIAGCGGAVKASNTEQNATATGTAPAQQASATATAVTSPEGAAPSTDQTTSAIYSGKSREEYEKSIPELKQKLETAPHDLDVLQQLAIAQYNTKHYEEAAATYQRMLAIKDDAFTRNNYANVLRDWGKTEEAKEQYRKAIETDPKLVVAYINLTSLLLREGKKDEAIALLDKGIANTSGEDRERLESYKNQVTESK